MKNYRSVDVRLPNGEKRKAEITAATHQGYRNVRVPTTYGKIRGRVPSKYGFKRTDYALPMQVNAADAWMLGDSADGSTVFLTKA